MNFEQTLKLTIKNLTAETGLSQYLGYFLVATIVVLVLAIVVKLKTPKKVLAFVVLLGLVFTVGIDNSSVADSNAAELSAKKTNLSITMAPNSHESLNTKLSVTNTNENGYTLYARIKNISLKKVSIKINGVKLSTDAKKIISTSSLGASKKVKTSLPLKIDAYSKANLYKATGKIVYTIVENTPDMSRYYNQSISWKKCDVADSDITLSNSVIVPNHENYECAKIKAPTNWYNENSSTITLALARYKATDTLNYKGALLMNPGGPGGSGISSHIASGRGKQFSEGIYGATEDLAGYDITSWDPRGVARSSQLVCDEYDAKSCFKRTLNKELPYYMDTVTQAHDLDLVRALSNDGTDTETIGGRNAKLNYLGFSWGSMLGSAYTGFFPDKVGRMVLDGITPYSNGRSIVGLGITQNRVVETSNILNDFLANCTTDSTMTDNCPFTLYQDYATAKLNIDSLRAEYDDLTKSVLMTDDYPSNSFVYELLTDWNDKEQPHYAEYLNDAKEYVDTTFSVGIHFGAMDKKSHINPDDMDLYNGTFRNELSVDDTSSGSNIYVTSCEDQQMTSKDDKIVSKQIDTTFEDMPNLKAIASYGIAISAICTGVKLNTLPNPNYGNIDLPTILLSRSNFDYNTPPALTDEMLEQFPNKSLLIYEGAGHCSYKFSRELEDDVNEFFNTGVMPPNNKHYPRTPFAPL
jgi:pimeloyl-ACP methyl ester carboxylesterase